MADTKKSDLSDVSSLKVGQRVRILIGGPMETVVDGTVRVIQDEPGKKVGVELDNYAETGHTLDGLLDDTAPQKSDEVSGRNFGKGWWTLDDHVEAL